MFELFCNGTFYFCRQMEIFTFFSPMGLGKQAVTMYNVKKEKKQKQKKNGQEKASSTTGKLKPKKKPNKKAVKKGSSNKGKAK